MKKSSRVPLGMLRLATAGAAFFTVTSCSSRQDEVEEALVSEEFSAENFPPAGTGLVTKSGDVVEAPNLSDKVEVENDAYTPSVGYYHAPCNQWFPHPWNYYEEGKGYFQCGSWVPQPSHPTVVRSYPSYHSVHYARGMWMGTYGYRESNGWSFGRRASDTHYGPVSNFSSNRPRPSSVSSFSSGSTSSKNYSSGGSTSSGGSSISKGGFGSSGSSFSSGS